MSKITENPRQNPGKSPGTGHVPTPDEIWKILKEVSLGQKETDRRIQASREETNRIIREMREETAREKQETDRRIQAGREETNRIIREMREETAREKRETERRIQADREETDRIIREMREETERQKQERDRIAEEMNQETEQNISKLDDKFGNLWEDWVDTLIQGNLIQVLKEGGLNIERTMPLYKGHFKAKGHIREFGLIALNRREIVVVETKSSLDQPKAEKFLKVMAQFNKYCPEFSSLTAYAGMACLRAAPDALKYVIENGLFIIRVQGKNAELLNPKGFKPRVFNKPASFPRQEKAAN